MYRTVITLTWNNYGDKLTYNEDGNNNQTLLQDRRFNLVLRQYIHIFFNTSESKSSFYNNKVLKNNKQDGTKFKMSTI